jgi:hypothetical protein
MTEPVVEVPGQDPIAAIPSSFFFFYLARYRERHVLVPFEAAATGGSAPLEPSPEGSS